MDTAAQQLCRLFRQIEAAHLRQRDYGNGLAGEWPARAKNGHRSGRFRDGSMFIGLWCERPAGLVATSGEGNVLSKGKVRA
jgi:hypothetical protein